MIYEKKSITKNEENVLMETNGEDNNERFLNVEEKKKKKKKVMRGHTWKM